MFELIIYDYNQLYIIITMCLYYIIAIIMDKAPIYYCTVPDQDELAKWLQMIVYYGYDDGLINRCCLTKILS